MTYTGTSKYRNYLMFYRMILEKTLPSFEITKNIVEAAVAGSRIRCWIYSVGRNITLLQISVIR